MAKLAHLMKELNETKNLLIEQFTESKELREMNDNLRQLNAKLSKEVKALKEYSSKVEEENKKLKKDLVDKNVQDKPKDG